jgi:predicted nucleic acid-binding protein
MSLPHSDREVADLATQLRREHHRKLPDVLQAATALQHDLVLVTRNTKDLPPELLQFVLLPYRP